MSENPPQRWRRGSPGFSISLSIIEGRGGSLWVDEPAEKGAYFRFPVPSCSAEAVAARGIDQLSDRYS